MEMPTEQELDKMVDAEIEHAEIEARKTPLQKLSDNVWLLEKEMAHRDQIIKNIRQIIEELAKI